MSKGDPGFRQIDSLDSGVLNAEGLDETVGSFVVEDSPNKMAELINTLYEDLDSLRKISDAGKKLIEMYFTPEKAKEILLEDMSL